MATTVSNVINDLHFCYEVIGSGKRCPNCTHKGMKDDDKLSCEDILIKETIGYLKEYRNILDAADPNDSEWVVNLLKKEKGW